MEAICHYCGEPCDPDFTVSLFDDSTVFAHKHCYEHQWDETLIEIESDYQFGRTDWHVVNGKIERRSK